MIKLSEASPGLLYEILWFVANTSELELVKKRYCLKEETTLKVATNSSGYVIIQKGGYRLSLSPEYAERIYIQDCSA